MTTEAQLSKITYNLKPHNDTRHFHSSDHQILGGKTVMNVQIDPQQQIYGRKS